MPYTRVLPRDLFNEANLLKCVGALWIAVEGKAGIAFEQEEVSTFAIDQDPADGSLTILNVTLMIRGTRYNFSRPLNSRDAFPLYVRPALDDDADETQVFTSDGKLHPDMLALIAGEAS